MSGQERPAEAAPKDPETANTDFRITLIAKIKHADLLIAVRKLGSQVKLAEHLGVNPVYVGDWINLQTQPSQQMIDRHPDLEQKLFDLTGKLLDELFPVSVAPLLGGPKTVEVTKGFNQSQLASLAARQGLTAPEQLALVDYDKSQEKIRQLVDKSLVLLTPQERTVVMLRFGLPPAESAYTQHEIAEMWGVTNSRIQQIEKKALYKLRAGEYHETLKRAASEMLDWKD